MDRCIECSAFPLETTHDGMCATCYIVQLCSRIKELEEENKLLKEASSAVVLDSEQFIRWAKIGRDKIVSVQGRRILELNSQLSKTLDTVHSIASITVFQNTKEAYHMALDEAKRMACEILDELEYECDCLDKKEY